MLQSIICHTFVLVLLLEFWYFKFCSNNIMLAYTMPSDCNERRVVHCYHFVFPEQHSSNRHESAPSSSPHPAPGGWLLCLLFRDNQIFQGEWEWYWISAPSWLLYRACVHILKVLIEFNHEMGTSQFLI